MSQAGARLVTTDDKGRTLLHAAVSNPDGPPALLSLLVDSGLDPFALDAEGNTLWHAAVPRLMRWPLRCGRDLCDFLVAQGVDHRKPNIASPFRGRLWHSTTSLICTASRI